MNALEIKHLCKSFPGFCLDDLNLTLPSGCILGLIGENGAGKSTTIKLILDVLHKDSGSITILGRDNLDNIQLTKEDVGVVLDEVGIPECLNTHQVGKVMSLTFHNWNNDAYKGYLKALAIPEKKPFKDFSRGTKMKLGIAIALSHGAKLLLLDEATNGLDPVAREQVVELLSEFTRDESHAILISSHIVSDLEKLCDYIAFLHKGKLMLCEEKDLLMSRYGILHCTKAQLADLDPGAVLHKTESPYAVEALVFRDAVPEGTALSPISIEELFVFMSKEAD
ncbi:MAG: ABC transporter ATP-binding protein [Candidatus Faecousia sp.]|nr:ABC transporter ATP-binding protein [Candidatus Faecousia sp.]